MFFHKELMAILRVPKKHFGPKNKGLDEVPGVTKVPTWNFLSMGVLLKKKKQHLSCLGANTTLTQKGNVQRCSCECMERGIFPKALEYLLWG